MREREREREREKERERERERERETVSRCLFVVRPSISLESVSNEVPSSACTYTTLGGSFGNDRSLLHSLNKIILSIES
jgi:hypothetical protein